MSGKHPACLFSFSNGIPKKELYKKEIELGNQEERSEVFFNF